LVESELLFKAAEMDQGWKKPGNGCGGVGEAESAGEEPCIK
jgi:hypothetical protein